MRRHPEQLLPDDRAAREGRREDGGGEVRPAGGRGPVRLERRRGERPRRPVRGKPSRAELHADDRVQHERRASGPAHAILFNHLLRGAPVLRVQRPGEADGRQDHGGEAIRDREGRAETSHRQRLPLRQIRSGRHPRTRHAQGVRDVRAEGPERARREAGGRRRGRETTLWHRNVPTIHASRICAHFLYPRT